MKKLLPLFILLFFISCAHRQIYVNNSGSCQLKLYSDSTYHFKYPTFLRKMHESGTYKIRGNSIVLKRVVQTTYDYDTLRKFSYVHDTITVNGIDPKVIGSDRRLTKK